MSYDETLRRYVVERPSADGYHVGWLRKVGDDIADQCVFLMGPRSGRYYCGIYPARPHDCRDFTPIGCDDVDSSCRARRRGRSAHPSNRSGAAAAPTAAGFDDSPRRPLRRRFTRQCIGGSSVRSVADAPSHSTGSRSSRISSISARSTAASGGVRMRGGPGCRSSMENRPARSARSPCTSDPRIVYAGSGEGLQRPDLAVGDGIYKLTDGGETWTHLALRDGQQIASIAIDPKDENRLFVAVLGHPYGPNATRRLSVARRRRDILARALQERKRRRLRRRSIRPTRRSSTQRFGRPVKRLGNRIIRDCRERRI